MLDLRSQILANLAGEPITFLELMDSLDFSDLPPRKSQTGQTIGYHSLIMDMLVELMENEVAVEVLSPHSMPTYRLYLPHCDRWVA